MASRYQEGKTGCRGGFPPHERNNKNPGVSDAESAFEITYNAPISENLYLQPDIQWIFDAHESNEDVFVVGLRVGVEF